MRYRTGKYTVFEACPCIFEPGNVTGWSSEGVNRICWCFLAWAPFKWFQTPYPCCCSEPVPQAGKHASLCLFRPPDWRVGFGLLQNGMELQSVHQIWGQPPGFPQTVPEADMACNLQCHQLCLLLCAHVYICLGGRTGGGVGGGGLTNNWVLLLSYQLCLKAHEFAILTVHLFQAVIKMLLFPPFLLVQFGHQNVILMKNIKIWIKTTLDLRQKYKKRSQDVKDSNSHNNYMRN